MNLRVKGWLPDMDLNHDKQIQSLLCYRYTIGQIAAPKVNSRRGESRGVPIASALFSRITHHASRPYA